MIVAITIVTMVAAYAGASLYVRKAFQYTKTASEPLNKMCKAAKEVVSDPDAPLIYASFAAGAVLHSGSGWITRQFLKDWVVGLFYKRDISHEEWPTLSNHQNQMFTRIVFNSMYYDSLCVPFSGFLLRRLVFPSLRALANEEVPAGRSKIAVVAESTNHVISHSRRSKEMVPSH